MWDRERKAKMRIQRTELMIDYQLFSRRTGCFYWVRVVFLYMFLSQHILMVSKKNKKKMFNGTNMIGIKIWRQRSETGNLFYHMVTTGAIFFFFFFLNYSTFKSKGMHVGTGFWRAIPIRINFLASNLIYRILYLRKTLYRERIWTVALFKVVKMLKKTFISIS